jgi:hypothetical protein
LARQRRASRESAGCLTGFAVRLRRTVEADERFFGVLLVCELEWG